MYQADPRVTYTRWQGEREKLRGESRDKRCREPYRRGAAGPPPTSLVSPRLLLPDVVVRLPAPAPQHRPVRGGKMHFPTVGKFMAHGTMASDIPDKAMRYALLLSSRYLVFPLSLSLSFLRVHAHIHTRACTGLNNFYSLFGQTRYTMRRDVSILERPFLPADSGRIYGALADHLGWIVRGECVQCSRLRYSFFRLAQPFQWYFYCEIVGKIALEILCSPREVCTILLLYVI